MTVTVKYSLDVTIVIPNTSNNVGSVLLKVKKGLGVIFKVL